MLGKMVDALERFKESIGKGETFLNVLNSGVWIDVSDAKRAAVAACQEILSDTRKYYARQGVPRKRARK